MTDRTKHVVSLPTDSETEFVPLAMRGLMESFSHIGLIEDPIIDGLLRRGEVMSLVAAPKVGKTWLALHLGLSTAIGAKWLGKFQATKGKVLYVDAELQKLTFDERIRSVADVLGVPQASPNFLAASVNGLPENIATLCYKIPVQFKPGELKLIILDCLSILFPPGVDENSNSGIGHIVRSLCQLAVTMGCGIVVTHHTSKGDQNARKLSDIGAGAGAFSRFCSSHVVVREHAQKNVIVMDGIVRSWKKDFEPICFLKSFPQFEQMEGVDPYALKALSKKQTADTGKFIVETLKNKKLPILEIKRLAKESGLVVDSVVKSLAKLVDTKEVTGERLPSSGNKLWYSLKT